MFVELLRHPVLDLLARARSVSEQIIDYSILYHIVSYCVICYYITV